jgi:hypothetical protein
MVDDECYKPVECTGCNIKCGTHCSLRWPDTPERLIKQYCNSRTSSGVWTDYVLAEVTYKVDSEGAMHREYGFAVRSQSSAYEAKRRRERTPYSAHYKGGSDG